MSDTPIDPRTGRVKLGGRAQRSTNDAWWRARCILVEYPYGYVVHLVPTRDGKLAKKTLCLRLIDGAAPSTSTWRTGCKACERNLQRWTP